MKKILLILILAAVFTSCTKPKKTRSGLYTYTCYIYDVKGTISGGTDTVVYGPYVSTVPYPSVQQWEDTLNAGINIPSMWYECQ